VCARICATSFSRISAGDWSGTSRQVILAWASQGITVFTPGPVKPPQMPFTSRVGRADARS